MKAAVPGTALVRGLQAGNGKGRQVCHLQKSSLLDNLTFFDSELPSRRPPSWPSWRANLAIWTTRRGESGGNFLICVL